MKLCQLLLCINTTLNWGLIFTAVSSQQAIIISAWGQILKWCKMPEQQRSHRPFLSLFSQFSINTKEIMPKAWLQGSDLLSQTPSASPEWPVLGDFHLKNTSAHECNARGSVQEHHAACDVRQSPAGAAANTLRHGWNSPREKLTASRGLWAPPDSIHREHRGPLCSQQPARICWSSTIVTLCSTLCWGPRSNISLEQRPRLKPCLLQPCQLPWLQPLPTGAVLPIGRDRRKTVPLGRTFTSSAPTASPSTQTSQHLHAWLHTWALSKTLSPLHGIRRRWWKKKARWMKNEVTTDGCSLPQQCWPGSLGRRPHCTTQQHYFQHLQHPCTAPELGQTLPYPKTRGRLYNNTEQSWKPGDSAQPNHSTKQHKWHPSSEQPAPPSTKGLSPYS